MTTKTFIVSYNIQNPTVNKLVVAADLGVVSVVGTMCIHNRVTIDWSDGEIVDQARIEKTIQNLKVSFESFGYHNVHVKQA